MWAWSPVAYKHRWRLDSQAAGRKGTAMEWYWWVLIGVGVVVIGYLKLEVWGKIMANMKAKKKSQAALAEED